VDLIHIPTGKTIYKIDDGAGHALLLAMPEAFKRTEPKPTYNVQPQSTPTTPHWVVRNHPLTGKPELVFATLNQEQRYPGPNCCTPTAESAQEAFTACGHPVPRDVLDKFSALLEDAKGNDPDIINEARFQAQSEQYVREQKERAAAAKLQAIG